MSGAPAIPRRLGHIWIGPKPAPKLWMDSWPKLHPDWSYTVYGNDTLIGYPFRLRRLINEYAWRGAWAGAQDMMRYELLYRYGGFMADADAISLHAVDELLDQPRAYTVFDRPETDKLRGVCPFLACEPGNPFVGAVIDELAKLEPWELRKPEVSTGNRFLMRMIRERAPGPDLLKIFPTQTFIPWQKSAPDVWYDGPDKVYAEQKWGTSTFAYNRAHGPSDKLLSSAEVQAGHTAILDRLAGAFGDRHGSGQPGRALRLAAVKATGERLAQGLESAETVADFAALNGVLCGGMTAAGLAPRFQGAHFYRHMQQQPLTEGKLRTRSDAMRRQLLGWLGTATRALVIGYDTGHLVLGALQQCPDLKIAATDAARWPDEGDKAPPDRARYVPLARDWLAARFPDRLQIEAIAEPGFLASVAKADQGFDLVLFADVDIYALRTLMAACPHLADGVTVVAASVSGDGGRRFADRLQVQGLTEAVIFTTDFGPDNGSISAVNLELSAVE